VGFVCYQYYYESPDILVLEDEDADGKGKWKEFPKPTMRTSAVAQSHDCDDSESITDIIECYMPGPGRVQHLAIIYYLSTFCPVTRDEINAITAAKSYLLNKTRSGLHKYGAVMGVLDLLSDSNNTEGLKEELGVDGECAASWLEKDRKRGKLLSLAVNDAAPNPNRFMPWMITVEREPGSGGQYLNECGGELPAVKAGKQDIKVFRLNEAENIYRNQKWKWVFNKDDCNITNSFISIGHRDDTQLVKDAVANYTEELMARNCSIESFNDNFVIMEYVRKTANIPASRDRVKEAMMAQDMKGLEPYLYPSQIKQISRWMGIPYQAPSMQPTSQQPTQTPSSQPTTAVPTVIQPTMAVPNITVPTMAALNISVPTMAIPNITAPTIAIPNITAPTMAVSNITAPTMAVSNITAPTIKPTAAPTTLPTNQTTAPPTTQPPTAKVEEAKPPAAKGKAPVPKAPEQTKPEPIPSKPEEPSKPMVPDQQISEPMKTETVAPVPQAPEQLQQQRIEPMPTGSGQKEATKPAGPESIAPKANAPAPGSPMKTDDVTGGRKEGPVTPVSADHVIKNPVAPLQPTEEQRKEEVKPSEAVGGPRPDNENKAHHEQPATQVVVKNGVAGPTDSKPEMMSNPNKI